MSTANRMRVSSVRGTPASHHKIAERLTILNNRAPGMLTRLYNLKKQLADPKTRPAFMAKREMAQAIATTMKKFPAIDCKSIQLPAVQQSANEVLKSLEPYYLTFIDLLQFKEHVVDCIKVIDELYMFMDITVNSHLTIGYLELVTNYVRLCILLSRVEERKVIIGLWSATVAF